MSDKNDKASSKPIPPGKQAYWLINCFAEGKLNYYTQYGLISNLAKSH